MPFYRLRYGVSDCALMERGRDAAPVIVINLQTGAGWPVWPALAQAEDEPTLASA